MLPDFDPIPTIAKETSAPPAAVEAVIGLLGEGNTVPFIARYRKERTQGLDEVQIRTIQERVGYLKELHERKATILQTIDEQGKLNATLRKKILACDARTELEDIYLPYRPKRKTRASQAIELGLEPLAELILAQGRQSSPSAEARRLVATLKGVESADDALAGARDIVAERVAETAEVRAFVRDTTWRRGQLCASVIKKKQDEQDAGRFKDYFDFSQPLSSLPSHRFLAIMRGQREGFLRVKVDLESERLVGRVLEMIGQDRRSPFADELGEAVADSYKRLLAPSVSKDIVGALKEKADETAIDVFAENLRNLLLSAPAGARPTIAVDPGLRTGSKCVVLDDTGNYIESKTLFLVRGQREEERARKDLRELVERHRPFAVAVGNGTGGRESESFAKAVLRDAGLDDVVVVSVNEAGASVYSASDVAREEFPDLDLTLRGAISIGRRFQDPLSELVKIDPKAIGVGQYQHDVDQKKLAAKLDEVVESCVNHVGVDLNTASVPLLSYVAGIGPKLAGRVVETRRELGSFSNRRQLLEVSGLGPKTFEQAAGFLRIREAKHPLDASAVHPERYRLVERIARDLGAKVVDLVGNTPLIDKIDLRRYVDDEVGVPTLRDIVNELKKPGRDPRDTFEPPAFRDDVHSIDDLREGMVLEGVVTNVTNFGAFVDVGVHQDGLVHISQLADRYVRDPHEVVKVGQRISVRVLEIDKRRKRIGLSARSNSEPAQRGRS